MTTKYVIELGDDVQFVTKVGVTASGNAYSLGEYKADLEELNSDYINEHYGDLQDEAYHQGLEEGYERGLTEGKKAFDLLDAERDAEYQRGLEDAWEAARKMALMDTETSENVTGYFGLFRIMENLTPMQAIEKLKAYEEKQKADDEIKVGDEVISLRKNGEVIEDMSPWIVTYETKYAYQGFDACGMFHNNPKERVHKTGRHFDIHKILKEMQS